METGELALRIHAALRSTDAAAPLLEIPHFRLKVNTSDTLSSIVREVVRHAQRDAPVAEQDLYCILEGWDVLAPRDLEITLSDVGITESARLYFSASWMQFALSSPTHHVLVLADVPFAHRRLLLTPPCMGYNIFSNKCRAGSRALASLSFWNGHTSQRACRNQELRSGRCRTAVQQK